MQTSVQKEKSTLPQRVRKLEEAIITISGPALATSGIIAGIDILTNNIIARYAPTVGAIAGVVWAVCLMLTLDFQVLTLGVRAHRVYTSSKGGMQKAFEIVLACAIALALAYVSMQMGSIFSRMIGTSLSIEQAAGQLNINVISLIWERSAMVMLLIFMSGWLRDVETGLPEQVTPQVAPAAQPQAVIPPETLNLLIERLNTLTVTVQQISSTPAPVPQLESPKNAEPLDASLVGQQADSTESAPEAEQVSQPSEQRYGDQIEALYRKNEQITAQEIVTAIGCSRKTASKWLERVRPV